MALKQNMQSVQQVRRAKAEPRTPNSEPRTPRATSISKPRREERATRKSSQLAAARRVAMKMGRRPRCSSVTYRSGYAPSSRLPAAHFDRNDRYAYFGDRTLDRGLFRLALSKDCDQIYAAVPSTYTQLQRDELSKYLKTTPSACL